MAGKDAKKILVRAPNWIGDAVMALPALEALKALYRKADITVLAKGRTVPVFQNNPHISEIIEYDDKRRHSGISGRLKLGGEIKRRGFDTAVLFQNAFDAAFLSFISGIPKRIGYARDFRSRLLTNAIPVTDEIKKVHQAFYYLNIVKTLGGEVPPRPLPRIYISPAERSWVEEFVSDNGLKRAFLIGAAPGASYGPAKRWPPEKFAEALTILCEGRNGFPLIFGGPEDKEACREVSKMLKMRHLDLSGKVYLRQFMALVARLNLFITNDSGPMHVGSALSTPTVAIFGSTDATLTGPLGPFAKVIKREIDCSPCFERTCKFKHYRCLEVEPKEVARAAEALLKEKEGAGKGRK